MLYVYVNVNHSKLAFFVERICPYSGIKKAATHKVLRLKGFGSAY